MLERESPEEEEPLGLAAKVVAVYKLVRQVSQQERWTCQSD